MACRLTGAKPLSEPVREYWTLRNKLQWNLNRSSKFFIQEHAFESVVCETVVILSRPQWNWSGWLCPCFTHGQYQQYRVVCFLAQQNTGNEWLLYHSIRWTFPIKTPAIWFYWPMVTLVVPSLGSRKRFMWHVVDKNSMFSTFYWLRLHFFYIIAGTT